MSIKINHGGKGGKVHTSLKFKLVTLATAITLSGAAAVVPIAAVADHTTAHTIEQLSAQISALQAQLAALAGGSTGGVSAGKCSFTRSLTVGSRGDDVTCLQNYLTSTGHFTYAGGATGYFGGVTRSAVAAWQAANGVSPTAGYFGSISQAKYNSLVAGGAVVTPVAPTTPGTTPTVPVAVGSGLTITAPAEQPAATLAPESAARIPFVKAIFTASADGDVTVKSVTVERKGLADDAAFDGILLLDEDGTQIGNTKTLSSEHKVSLSDSLVIKAGTSKTISVAAHMVADNSGRAGQVARLAIVKVDAGTTQVNASLPIEGNGMTINSTLDIGTVTMSIGSLDPGAANTKTVGTKGYYLASVKASVGSAENMTVESIRFNQAGSAAASDLANVLIVAGGKDYPAVVSSDGKYYVAKFPGGLKVAKGANIELSVKADLIDGSARTVDMNILRKADIVVKGDVFGYYALPGGGSSGAASAGAFSTNQEPFFNAYVATIDKGSVLVSSSSKVPSNNVPVDVSDVILGGFLIDVKGEPVQVSSFRITFTFSGTGTATDVTGVKIMTDTGSIYAGPKDAAAAGITFTDTFTLPVGENHLFVKGKLDTTFVSNDTVQVATDPDDLMTVKGTVTGLAITASPTSQVTSNTQTVKAGTVALSVSPTPFGQTVVRGVNGFHFATLVFDAGNSGEDVRATSIKLRDTYSTAGIADNLNSCVLYDGATALNTGSDVVNPDDPASGTTDDTVFTLTNNLVVPKGTVKKIDLKCNISSSATSGSTHSWGLNDTSAHNVVGATTGQSVTESVTTSVGSTMTIRSSGSFTVTKDSSSPTQAMVIAGKIDVPILTLRYSASDEAVNIKELTLTYSSTTASTSDFLKATLWDGATKIAEAVWAGNNEFATSTFTSNFIVPKDGDRLLTVKVDLASISVIASTTAGRLLGIDYNGVSSSSGNGVSSGLTLGSGSAGSIQGATMQLMKSVPTIAKIAVPSTSLPQTNAILYRFSVKADSAGPIGLYKFTFLTASSSVSATSSNFDLFAYSDASFSTQKYDKNPLNSARQTECAGLSNIGNDTNGCNVAGGITVGPYATSTVGAAGAVDDEVVFFFTPVANVASTTEAIVVGAGETVYFELRGDITIVGGSTGNTLPFTLAGDSARPERISATGNITTALGGVHGAFHDSARGRLATAALIAVDPENNNDFVWSPLSTTTVVSSATSTNDWTNGFLVPGLPSTDLPVNTFSN